MERRLEIGPGPARLGPDWTTVDCTERSGIVDVVCRWGLEPLLFPNYYFSLVYACHVLEHVPWYNTLNALAEAHRVLIPGGALELHVPDFDILARAVREQICLDDHAEGGLNEQLHWMYWVAERLFHCGSENQWHRACFNEPHLRWCLEEVGFRNIVRIFEERGTDHGVINLGMRAEK